MSIAEALYDANAIIVDAPECRDRPRSYDEARALARSKGVALDPEPTSMWESRAQIVIKRPDDDNGMPLLDCFVDDGMKRLDDGSFVYEPRPYDIIRGGSGLTAPEARRFVRAMPEDEYRAAFTMGRRPGWTDEDDADWWAMWGGHERMADGDLCTLDGSGSWEVDEIETPGLGLTLEETRCSEWHRRMNVAIRELRGPAKDLQRKGFQAFGIDELDQVKPPTWLIEGLLPADSLAMLYGPSGSGKSFVALDVALAIAHERESALAGSFTVGPAHGPVIYIAAEGGHGMRGRIEAWQKADESRGFAPFTLITEAVNLADADQVARLADGIGTAALVIFDTLARCSAGADENSARDMGAVIGSLDTVRQKTGACVLVIHHSGKDARQGARGSSALRAAMDTELEVTSGGNALRLAVTKQKDAPEAETLSLRLKPYGESAVVARAGSDITTTATDVLAALDRIAGPEGVSSNDWQTAVGGRKVAFLEAKKALLRASHVENVATEERPRWVVSTPDDE